MANGTNNRRAGRIYFKVDGTQYDAKGKFSYNLGLDKREAIVGADGVHGYKSTPQVAHGRPQWHCAPAVCAARHAGGAPWLKNYPLTPLPCALTA